MRLCGIGLVVAALLISTSSRPHLSIAACTSRWQSASFDTSPCTAMASAPAALQAATTASPPALLLA